MQRIFLLSPANANGKRAQMLLNARAEFPLAERLRGGGASIGEVFSFISGLYFRGKMAYTSVFGPGATRVITGGWGLVPPETVMTCRDLEEMAAIAIDLDEPRYRDPLERDARALGASEVVLLGSIATAKYFEPLTAIYGERLLFPQEFVGRGDMSRGGLMLRCAESQTQLTYISALTAIRRGARPPKLPKLR